MRGQVLGVDHRIGRGVVAGDDGQRYTFGPDDWAQPGEPSIGALVDFEAQGSEARSLFALQPAGSVVPVAPAAPPVPKNDRNKYVAALLAFFLGTLGIHRFYLGRNGSGVVMLVLSITIVGLLVTGLWALIDTVRYLVMPDDEFDARYRR